jgi:hypothetical protein
MTAAAKKSNMGDNKKTWQENTWVWKKKIRKHMYIIFRLTVFRI